MELRQLRYAIAVAEERHFTRAANRLHVAQSALSHQVQQLEHELGTALFTRTSRRVELTDAGEAFVLRAREVLAATERLRGDVASTAEAVTGTLRIGTITTLTQIDLAAHLRSFLDTHPGVDVHVVSAMSESIVAQVEAGELDLGFIGLWHTRPRAGLTARVLGTEQLVAVVARDHPWATRTTVTLLDLASVPTVDFPEGTGPGGRATTRSPWPGFPARSSRRPGRRAWSPRSPKPAQAWASSRSPMPSPGPPAPAAYRRRPYSHRAHDQQADARHAAGPRLRRSGRATPRRRQLEPRVSDRSDDPDIALNNM